MSPRQRLGQTLKQSQYQGAKQIQDLTISQDLKLERMIREELSLNPALEIDEGPVFDEDVREELPDGWNPDFVKPEDEWETGDSPVNYHDYDLIDLATGLEKVAEDYCGDDIECLNKALEVVDKFRTTGKLPEEAGIWLKDALSFLRESFSELRETHSPHSAFNVKVKGDCVTAILTASIAEFTSIKKIRGFSNSSKKFLEQKRNRLIFLNGIARHLLEDLQSDFFRQKDLNSALLALLPIPVDVFARLDIQSLVKLDKAYLSKLGNLLVSCHFGVFPLSLFWPEKAALIRAWVRTAQVKGINKVSNMRDWILQKINKRQDGWPHSDKRRVLITPLLEIKVNDIRNALKAIRK